MAGHERLGGLHVSAILLYLVATTSIVTCGGVDDQLAVQDAVDNSTVVELPDGPCVVDGIVATHATVIRGSGPLSSLVMRLAPDGIALSCQAFKCSLSGFNVDGQQNTSMQLVTTSPRNRHGIVLAAQSGSSISEVTVTGFGADAVRITTPGLRQTPATKVNGLTVMNSFRGLVVDPGAEYVQINNLRAIANRKQVVVAAGNIFVSNVVLNEGGIGVELVGTGVANNAHGVWSVGGINHHPVAAISCVDATLGHTFSSLQIHDGDIVLTNCTAIEISAERDVRNITITGGGRNRISGPTLNGYAPKSITITNSDSWVTP
jgi:hypothetical protein